MDFFRKSKPDINTEQKNVQKPGFLVIGVQKAATSWLFVQLSKHSKIWMPPVKELHYFDHCYLAENRKWTQQHIIKGAFKSLKWQVNNVNPPNPPYLNYLVNLMGDDMFSEDWYLRAFSRKQSDGVIQGDITPEYCTIPDEGVSYVKDLLPDVKIMMVVRDPVKRAESQLRMNISRRGIAPENLTKEQWEELSSEEAIYNRAQYKEYIPTWEKYYSNIHYIAYQDVSKNPKKVISEALHYLQLPEENINGLKDRVHAGVPADIPQYVTEKFRNKFSDQYKFLEQRFDPAFLERI